MFAQGFDVFDEMPGGVVVGACIGTRLTAAALVKEDYAVMLRVEELRVRLATLTSRTTVKIDDWEVSAT